MEENMKKISKEELMEKLDLSEDELDKATGGASVDFSCVASCMLKKFNLPVCMAECLC